MGVDTEGHIPSDIGIGMIADRVASLGGENVWPKRAMDDSAYTVITFAHGEDGRAMHVHPGLGVFGSTLISMSANSVGVTYVKGVVDTFGGVLVHDDASGDAEIIDGGYSYGNAIFVLKWALARGIVHGSTAADVALADEEFKKWLNK